MLVKALGKLIIIKLVQFSNAPVSIDFIDSFNFISRNVPQEIKALSAILVTYNTIAISLETYLMVTLGLIAINVLIGIVPIMICLRRTPYQILSKSDI